MIDTITYYLVWFIGVIILHELGHYVAFRFYGINPKISSNFWTITVGENKDLFKLRTDQFLLVLLAGIFSGLLFNYAFNDNYLTLVYLIFCGFDVLNIFFYWKYRKSYKSHGDNVINESINEIKKLRLAKWEK